MVLTDRQRDDLHAGIYEYLCSQPGFEKAASAIREAAPGACERFGDLLAASGGSGKNVNGSTPILEKKWTMIPRLQKRVLELEKQAAQSAKIHAHRAAGGVLGTESEAAGTRRMLPRLPASHTLVGHSMVVTCCAVHPVFTVAVSGSEDGTIKVSCRAVVSSYSSIMFQVLLIERVEMYLCNSSKAYPFNDSFLELVLLIVRFGITKVGIT